MKNNSNSAPGCVSIFVILLTVLFIGLKMTGNLDWTWFWVLSPLWAYFCLVAVLVIGILLYAANKAKW